MGLSWSAAGTRSASVPAFCGDAAVQLRLALDPVVAVGGVMRLNPPWRLAEGWAAMLLAMMPLLLAPPVMHVWRSTLRRRRGLAVAEFALGYATVWLAAGPALVATALLLQVVAGPAAPALALAAALAWSASPWRRLASNRAHRLAAIWPFGLAATRSCVTFGLRHGGWCIATCWAWMAAPLTASHWHLPAMVLAGVTMLAERLTPPGRPRWRLPAPLAAAGGTLRQLVQRPA